MRIAIHDYAGFPFPFELSRALSRRGHNVLHLFTQSSGGPKAAFGESGKGGLDLACIAAQAVEKDHFFKRWRQERRYGSFAVAELENWRPDFLISANTPIEAQKEILGWAEKKKVSSIFWLHDLLSIAAHSILSSVNPIFGWFAFYYLNWLEIQSLNKATHIVSITDDFSLFLNRWYIAPEKVSVIPNWGPIEQIPVLPRDNFFSRSHGLNGKFVLLYAGTLGKKQNIHLVADIAAKLSTNDDFRFVVATDDRGHQLLNQALVQTDSSNLIRLPLQPSDQYPYLLASADAALVTLKPSASRYCVPSKLWSIYCAQRPSIVAVDRRNLSARITTRTHSGIVVPPGSTEKVIAALERLKANPSVRFDMGKNARNYAEHHFPIGHIADAFESIIDRVASRQELAR